MKSVTKEIVEAARVCIVVEAVWRVTNNSEKTLTNNSESHSKINALTALPFSGI